MRKFEISLTGYLCGSLKFHLQDVYAGFKFYLQDVYAEV